jgi:RecJ-like exonuclease
MTDQVKKLIDELPKHYYQCDKCNGDGYLEDCWGDCPNCHGAGTIADKCVFIEDVIALVEKLTGWTKVEDGLPEYNKAVNVRFENFVVCEIIECTAKLENVTRHNCENSPKNQRWFVFPSSGHELTGRVTEWKPIIL